MSSRNRLADSLSALRGWLVALVDYLTLRKRMAGLGAKYPVPGTAAFTLGRFGLSMLRDAQQLDHLRGERDTAAVMYMNAITLMVRASETVERNLAHEGIDERTSLRSSELRERASAPILALLAGEFGPIDFAELSDADGTRAKLRDELRRTAHFLAAIVHEQQRPYRRLARLRAFRLGVAGVLLSSFLAWGAHALLTPTNLALHRPVTVSSRDPFWGVDPQRVVDGDELNLGFHSAYGTNATATVDLGRVRRIKAIELFNRPDCCEERTAPVAVQVSTDGVTYRTVLRRKRAFYRWKAALPSGTDARYVRLVHETTGYFHLAEIKVF